MVCDAKTGSQISPGSSVAPVDISGASRVDRTSLIALSNCTATLINNTTDILRPARSRPRINQRRILRRGVNRRLTYSRGLIRRGVGFCRSSCKLPDRLIIVNGARSTASCDSRAMWPAVRPIYQFRVIKPVALLNRADDVVVVLLA